MSREDSTMMSDDDQPLVANKPTVNGSAVANGMPNGHVESDSSMSEDDMPLSQSIRDKSESILTPESRSAKRKKPMYAESSSDDDTPLASSPAKPRTAAVSTPGATAATTVSKSATNDRKKATNGAAKDSDAADDDGDDKPKKPTKRPPRKKVKKQEPDGSVLEDEKPPKKVAKGKRKVKAESADASDVEDASANAKKLAKKLRAKKQPKAEPESGDELPKPKKRASKKKDAEENGSPTKGKKPKKEEEEDEEVFRWWEQDPDGDGTIKWQTLEHCGVLFPPPYEPLPSNVKMKYKGREVDLPPAAEEVAGFYAAMIETDHARDAVFNKNFFEDFKKVLEKHPPRNGIKITDFDLCDWRPMFEYFESEKAKKKQLTAAERKELKRKRDESEAIYTTCLLDGRKEKVGNFRVEPPGLFRGRGEHPKKGCLKFRVRPEDITINIGKDAPTPIPNVPGEWKRIQHDKTVTWLATWTENVNYNHKYVFLAAGSSLKGQSDMNKFEKARELKNHVDRIRLNYQSDLRSKVMADRQRATAMYFIDKLALRAGNEKGEDEADTVGCCSLRCEHVTLEAPNFIVFDFLGKDSIRYYNRVPVDAQVFKNVRIFKENKEDEDNLFDRVTTGSLNKHLNSEMKGLTAKVFRTFNASSTFQRLLDENSLEGKTLQEKLNAYNDANRQVAILCNHQRSAPKTHDQSMEKMRQRLRGFKYDRMKLRHALFSIDSAYKKDERYKADESDVDDHFVEEWEDSLRAKEIEKIEKKFAKENEKLEEEGKKPQNKSMLAERIQVIEDEFNRLAEERGTKAAALKRDRAPEKIEEAISKLDSKIKAFKLQIVDRDAGKEVALGTSKINYLDPRITAAWCRTHDVPIEKIFSKTLLTKFPWAMDVSEDWKF
ncbi:hypothetical protein BDN71DRAFT_1460986 [Pleurotus eryngii]|uniref:DNA topoisomerase I n=1 Tax=Pleurotus eryngii TaxID=5323 RepID=A0A9P6A8F9_PLEER|nr:hypothetical protein BDN71DRAFT_1460986 [Pleurotus eryngii]